MKILFLVTRADAVGGASIHTRDMAAALIRCGHQVLIGVGGTGPVSDGYKRAGAPFVSLSFFRRKVSPVCDVLAIAECMRLIRRFKPELVSAHTSKAGFIGRIAAALCGVPSLYTPHCWSFVDGFPRAGLYLVAERLVAPLARCIVAVSEDERHQGLSRGVGRRGQIITIHNGMADIARPLRAKPEVACPTLVMIGRFEEQKDHDCLLRALARLCDLEWRLKLVGDGPRRAEYERLCQQLGLTERVTFLGYRTDIPEVLSAAQIFLLITCWEGFPRSILEAMRAGLPVVATDVGGIREAVTEGQTGFLARRGDAVQLAEKMRPLIIDSALRRQMGERGRVHYERQFTFDRMLSRYVELYRNVLNGEARNTANC